MMNQRTHFPAEDIMWSSPTPRYMLKYWRDYKKSRRKGSKEKVVQHHPPAGAARRATTHLTNAAGSTTFWPSHKCVHSALQSPQTSPAKSVIS